MSRMISSLIWDDNESTDVDANDETQDGLDLAWSGDAYRQRHSFLQTRTEAERPFHLLRIFIGKRYSVQQRHSRCAHAHTRAHAYAHGHARSARVKLSQGSLVVNVLYGVRRLVRLWARPTCQTIVER